MRETYQQRKDRVHRTWPVIAVQSETPLEKAVDWLERMKSNNMGDFYDLLTEAAERFGLDESAIESTYDARFSR